MASSVFIALFLALVASGSLSFAPHARSSGSGRLWTVRSSSSSSSSEETEKEKEKEKNYNKKHDSLDTAIFNWSNFSRPEEYILFTRRRPFRSLAAGSSSPSPSPSPSSQSIRVDFRQPITWLGILFFVPVFSSEFFFAVSRSFICDLPNLPGLCESINN